MKIKLVLAALCCGAFVSCSQPEQANYQVIPLPQEINLTEGKGFVLDKKVQIIVPEDNAQLYRNAQFLAEYIKEATGIELSITTDETVSPAIRLALGVENENKEAYLMTIDAKQVGITGASEAGVFYGIQTLRKSLPKGTTTAVELPAANIYDYPRFSYRGAHFDVSRHFFPVDSVKRFIDMLALHNINRFHWHLTDDQGWRIEIKKYPELTTVAAYRPETVIGRNSGAYDGTPHDGHYTQDEAREIVAYAAERHITVIPEIDLPGHMQAALTAYPHLGCTGGPYEVWKMWGYQRMCFAQVTMKPFALLKMCSRKSLTSSLQSTSTSAVTNVRKFVGLHVPSVRSASSNSASRVMQSIRRKNTSRVS